MAQFVDLQKRHSSLLALQKHPPADFQQQVEAFIQELSEAGRSIYPAQERDQLRSYIRYWASLLYDLDRSQGYKVVDLQVYSGQQPALIWRRYRWVIIGGAVIGLLILAALVAQWNARARQTAERTATAAAMLGATPTPMLSPSPTSCQPPPGWVSYTVRPGDTLSSLASQSGARSEDILRANCISSDQISANDLIYLPDYPPTPLPTLSATPIAIPTPVIIPTPTISPTPVVYGPAVALESPANGESILPETTFSGSYANLNPGWSIHVILQSVAAAGMYYPLENFYTIPPNQPSGTWEIEANLAKQFNPEQPDTYIVTLAVANTEAIRDELSRAAASGMKTMPPEAILAGGPPVTATRKAYKVINEPRLLYAARSKEGVITQIYSARPDGSDALQLTFDANMVKRFPSLSADGRRIAYVANDPPNSPNLNYSIWVADSSGANPLAVLAESSLIYEQPVWSPDGRYLAYAARQRRSDALFNLYLFDLTGQTAVSEAKGALLTEIDAAQGNKVESRYPAWLNEREIVYSRRAAGRRELYKLNIETMQSTPFVDAGRNVVQPAISADGAQFACVSLDLQTGLPTILAGPVSGESTRAAVPPETNLSKPAWSADGAGLFAMDAIGQPKIWWVPLDGAALRMVNLKPDFAYDPYAGWVKAFLPLK